MYNLQKNNYHLKPKPSNIQTPLAVSQFIFELLSPHFPTKPGKRPWILDPCAGKGSLLEPWVINNYLSFGIDLEDGIVTDLKKDFLTLERRDICINKTLIKPALILCNPPFNGYGNKLGSEIWLDKILELFGKETPIVLFTPMGFRLNGKKSSKRWTKFTNHKYPPISSIISLPRDIFPGTEFHSEILIFNIPNLQPHYFLKTCPN